MSASRGLTHISFAQCMSTAWGNLARIAADDNETVREFTIKDRIFQPDGPLGKSAPGEADQTRSSDSMSLMTAEVRHQLDIGLKKDQLMDIRDGLTKSWYRGFVRVSEQRVLKAPHPEDRPEKERVRRESEVLAKKILASILASLTKPPKDE